MKISKSNKEHNILLSTMNEPIHGPDTKSINNKKLFRMPQVAIVMHLHPSP